MNSRAGRMLEEVGLSGLESEVYLALVREPCASGYRLAQMIGKPAPNTYKALDSLRTRGLVLLDDSSRTKTYSALPVGVYLENRRRELEEKQRELEREMADIDAAPVEGGIFRLTSVEQVFSRVRALLAGAERAVLLDAFPGPLEKLRPDVGRAVKRGVSVFVKAYRPVELKGADVVCPAGGDAPDLAYWNGDWLNITVDCRESLYSFIRPGGKDLYDAVWTRNQYVGMMNFNGLLHELLLTRVLQLLRQDKTREDISPVLRELGKRYLAMDLWRDAAPEGWMKDWPKEQ
ncbi:TrmB family transcriptional regulator, partial [candidate division WOR-3 bacterium]|nr:TrmB family transcriptional regulator [candidate division WOR-3 bacterium]